MKRTTFLLAVVAPALLLTAGLTDGGAAPAGCDAVPADYAALRNPVKALSAAEASYWTRQFKAKCARCHGEDGSGGGEEAKAQQAPPADFTDRAFMAACNDGQLFYQIMMGGEQKSAMPAFGPESSQGWSEDKVWHMVAFIRRFTQ